MWYFDQEKILWENRKIGDVSFSPPADAKIILRNGGCAEICIIKFNNDRPSFFVYDVAYGKIIRNFNAHVFASVTVRNRNHGQGSI